MAVMPAVSLCFHLKHARDTNAIRQFATLDHVREGTKTMKELTTQEAMDRPVPLMRRDVVEAFLENRIHPISKFSMRMIGEPSKDYHLYVEPDLEATCWAIAMQRFPDLAQDIHFICPRVDLNYTEVGNR
jgi:hypothetical protein